MTRPLSSRPLILRIVLGVIALLLLIAPLFVRSVVWRLNDRAYVADVPVVSLAATPVPTATPVVLEPGTVRVAQGMRAGPVVVDLAHGNRLNRNQFEPLAAALARRGLGMRFWLGTVDILAVTNYQDFPDQSEELQGLLENASALVVASPFFLWTQAEIGVVQRFVADGGHLLLISDPDVLGDLAQDINNLAEPFGIVFNDDYLYDTSVNDGNYTYIFQAQFLDQAAGLAGQKVAFYGARSISGEVMPQVRSTDTTLSSVRTGITGFTTVALGGLTGKDTAWRVLAMSDFDVLTAPFVERHDNRRLVEFVANFLASAQRLDTVTDFPAYLGKQVALIFGNASAVDAQILAEGSRLQDSLGLTGRQLDLASTTVLTGTLQKDREMPATDMIVLADYGMVDEETTLLRDLGFRLVEVTPTPMPGAEAAPAVGSQPGAESLLPAPATPVVIAGGAAMTTTGSVTDSTAISITATPTATPVATPTPQVTLYLEMVDGLRLVASQTILIGQLQLDEGHRLVAILGKDNAGIRAGVDRILSGDYNGCVTGRDLAICSFAEGEAPPTPAPTPPAGEPLPLPGTPTPQAEGQATNAILVVDDNDLVSPDDASEADVYLQVLTQMGHQPILWSTTTQGTPPVEELREYKWVIWSSGGYENGGPGVNDLDAMLGYINTGGHLTVSSRRPFFGMSPNDPSVIADVEVSDEVPMLVAGLPSEVIELANGLPPVTPLEAAVGDTGPKVALRRGPDSGDAGAPLLFLATDAGDANATGAQLMVLGMSLTWFPDDYDKQLVRNMAEVMLAP
ncbi:MAG: hypothetical protein DCC57_06775 [Chloroflexi bacterium]|nr:MAG: hypothetical protein DCC57_06775 [Chloroflexota bacterium]